MASAMTKPVPTPFCRRDTQVRVPFIWPEGELNLIDLDEEARKVLWPPLSDDSYDSDDSEPVEVTLPTGALTSFSLKSLGRGGWGVNYSQSLDRVYGIYSPSAILGRATLQ